jgi:hypothetical protein
MKSLLLLLVAALAAFVLAGQALAVGESKGQSPFTRPIKVEQIHVKVFPGELKTLWPFTRPAL